MSMWAEGPYWCWQRISKNKVSRQLCHGAEAEVVRHATGADVGD